MNGVLIISKAEAFTDAVKPLLAPNEFGRIKACCSSQEARRMLIEGEFELCIINTPLTDEFGDALAKEVIENNFTEVILAVRSEIYDEISSDVERYGILTLAKPLSRQVFFSVLSVAKASHNRIVNMSKKNKKLLQTIEDIKLVDRAKCVLIERMKMSEEAAHRYIEKQAMDTRASKTSVAEAILNAYET